MTRVSSWLTEIDHFYIEPRRIALVNDFFLHSTLDKQIYPERNRGALHKGFADIKAAWDERSSWNLVQRQQPHGAIGFVTQGQRYVRNAFKRLTGCEREAPTRAAQPMWNDVDMSDQLTPPSWHAALRGHDVVIVSPQYWGDYWVSKHWIAYELSRRLRTVFIEPSIWVGGVVKSPWKHRKYFRQLLQPLRKVDRELYVLSQKFFPRGVERRDDAPTVRTIEALHRMGIQRPIVLNFGTNFDLVKRLHGAVTVYYCVDPPFPDLGHENDEALTCEASDLIYAVSEIYRQHLAPLCTTQPVRVIPHGYAFEHARRIAEDSAVSCPIELQGLPRPILGFVGSIHDAYVDIDRVERLARRRPESSIVLIGPYQNNPLGPDLSSDALRRLRRLSNVHLLGPRHFLDVPWYVKYFDVCLVLVNVRDYKESAMTSKRTHFKWLSYLAMGKPVVAPAVSEANSISSLVYLAADDDSYLDAVDQALVEDRALELPRVTYASQFSFDRTLDLIAQPIAEFLHDTPIVR